MTRYYKLDDKNLPVECSEDEWDEWWFEHGPGYLARTKFPTCYVMTGFYGVTNADPPMLYSTNIYRMTDDHSESIDYPDERSALRGHVRIVLQCVREICKANSEGLGE